MGQFLLGRSCTACPYQGGVVHRERAASWRSAGLRAGALTFSLYTAPISEIADRHGVNLHLYADDTQIYLCFQVREDDLLRELSRLEGCIAEIRSWMILNKLMLNDAKTEFLVIVSPRQEGTLTIHGIRIGESIILPASQARNLGATLTST